MRSSLSRRKITALSRFAPATPDLATERGNAALGAGDVATATLAYRRALAIDGGPPPRAITWRGCAAAVPRPGSGWPAASRAGYRPVQSSAWRAERHCSVIASW